MLEALAQGVERVDVDDEVQDVALLTDELGARDLRLRRAA